MAGLSISIKEFRTLPIKEKVDLLFENQENNKKITLERFDRMETLIKDDQYDGKFHQKIQYVWLGALTIMIGLFKYVGLL